MSEISGSSSAFQDFELAGWQRAAAPYHEGFGPLTSQAAEPLLSRAGVVAGTRLLDVATGPGYVAAAGFRRGANVTAVDFSESMLETARRQTAGVHFCLGDAQALPFAGGTFDAVTMNFGMLHLASPESALASAFTVLRNDGRIAFTVWAPPDLAVVFGLVQRAVQTHGDLSVVLPEGPPFFRFSDPAEARRTLETIGFCDVRTESVAMVWRHRSGETVWRSMFDGSVRTAGILRGQTESALTKIREAFEQSLETYRRGDDLELPMPAMMTSATKPP